MRAQNLCLGYGPLTVIDSVDVEIEPGQLTALIGINGCGKTTLLRAFAGLHTPASGRVTGPAELPPIKRRDQLAYLPQRLPEGAHLTVKELVVMSADAPNRWRASKAALERADQALEQLELSALRDRYCHHLSGGEYRRAALAACLAQVTPWLILDEPCAGLDLYQSALLMRGLKEWLNADSSRGALVVLHDLNLCAQWADRCVVLSGGHIAASGSPEAVLTSDALSAAYGGTLQRFRHPERDHLVVLGPQP